MRHILLCVLFCAMLGLGGCAIEREVNPETIAEAVDLRIGLRSLSPAMDVRIIVIEKAGGKVLYNDYPGLRDDLYIIPVRAGNLDIYAIANESTRLREELGQVTRQSQLKPVILNYYEIDEQEITSTPGTYTNLPVMEHASVVVRAVANNPSACEVSTDGIRWSGTLTMQMKRMAVKVTLKLRKYTETPSDRVTINSAHISKVPHISYLLAKPYDGSQYVAQWINDFSLVFDSNADISRDDNYTTVFEGYVIPEHKLGNPADEDNATRLELYATYNAQNVVYRIPLRADAAIENYDLERNCHYIILATIKSEGEFFYTPDIQYEVLEWTDVHTGHDFGDEKAIVFEAAWTGGTNITGRNVRVEYNHYVEYNFTLTEPVGATWAATLTNPIDFDFDYSDGAVSGGVVGTDPYKIRIKPRNETSLNDIKTEFYITVNNGVRNIELNLPNRVAGTGNRYTIMQIPH